jgi:molecular chaperone GrpE (heat shock protein)
MEKHRFWLPLKLQLFAADGGAGEGSGGSGDSGTGGSGEEGEGKDGSQSGQGQGEGSKTFTQDDIDKIVNKTIARERTKWEKDFESKLTEAKTEAEKLAKMNAEQKADYERQQRETKLTEREGEITRRELRATALETLAEKGLPKQLADILVYTDADSTSKSIESVEKSFRDAVEAAVNERLKGDTPKGGGGKGNAAFDEISKIFAQRG